MLDAAAASKAPGWVNEIYFDLWVNAYMWKDAVDYLDMKKVENYDYGGTAYHWMQMLAQGEAAMMGLSELPELVKVSIPLARTKLSGESIDNIAVFRVHNGAVSEIPRRVGTGTDPIDSECFEVVGNFVFLYVKRFSDFSIAGVNKTPAPTPVYIPPPTQSITITAQTGPGGKITDPGTIRVPVGSSKTYTITPDNGKRILDVFVNGESIGGASTFTLSNIQRNMTISVVFTDASNFIIDAQVRGDGQISNPGRIAVAPGTDHTYTFKPNEGSVLLDVIVNGVSMGRIESYTILGIDSDVDIIAVFGKAADLGTSEHQAYVIGYPDGTVRPDGNFTREEVATIFFRLMPDGMRERYLSYDNPFEDVGIDRWSNTAISTLYNAGVINGRSSDSFDPSANITRAEFAAIAARFDEMRHNAEGMLTYTAGQSGGSRYNDITGHWGRSEIDRAASRGWIAGESNMFRPDELITRAEGVWLVNRVLERLPENPSDLHENMATWIDNMDQGAWYYLDIQEATNCHNCLMKDDGVHEYWVELVPAYDWTIWERN